MTDSPLIAVGQPIGAGWTRDVSPGRTEAIRLGNRITRYPSERYATLWRAFAQAAGTQPVGEVLGTLPEQDDDRAVLGALRELRVLLTPAELAEHPEAQVNPLGQGLGRQPGTPTVYGIEFPGAAQITVLGPWFEMWTVLPATLGELADERTMDTAIEIAAGLTSAGAAFIDIPS